MVEIRTIGNLVALKITILILDGVRFISNPLVKNSVTSVKVSNRKTRVTIVICSSGLHFFGVFSFLCDSRGALRGFKRCLSKLNANRDQIKKLMVQWLTQKAQRTFKDMLEGN